MAKLKRQKRRPIKLRKVNGLFWYYYSMSDLTRFSSFLFILKVWIMPVTWSLAIQIRAKSIDHKLMKECCENYILSEKSNKTWNCTCPWKWKHRKRACEGKKDLTQPLPAIKLVSISHLCLQTKSTEFSESILTTLFEWFDFLFYICYSFLNCYK